MQSDRDFESLLSDESFLQWLCGKASAEETERWNAWLFSAPHHQEWRRQALQLLEVIQFRHVESPEVEQEWQRLRQRLQLGRTVVAEPKRSWSWFAWPRLARPRPRLGYAAFATAAIMVFVLVWRYLPRENAAEKDEFQIVSTDFGQRTQITFADSTQIVLNAHSTLKYPSVWKHSAPLQFELHGEAYFHVSKRAPGTQRDFVVRTDEGKMRVLGTRFAVHDRSDETRVVVEEGSVEVTVEDTTGQPNSLVRFVMRPGDLLEFRKGSHSLAPRNVNVGPYLSWWRHHLILADTPVEQILARLEETYGVHIEVTDKSMLKRTLSGSIENRNLEAVLRALVKALGTRVTRIDDRIIIGNTPGAKRNP